MNNQFISCLPSTSTAVYTKPEQAASTSSLPEIPPQNQDISQHKQPSNNDSEMSVDEQSESLQNAKLGKCRVLNINNDEANTLRILPRPISPDVVILQHEDQELSDDDAPRSSLPEIPHIGQEASGHPEITTSQELVREVPDTSKKAINELVGTSTTKFDPQVEIDETLNFMPLSSRKLENCIMLNRKHNEEDAVRPLSPDVRILPSISPSHKDQKFSDDECMQEDVLKLKPNRDENMGRDIVETVQGLDQNDQPMEKQKEIPKIIDLQCAVMRLSKIGISPFPEPDENGAFGRLDMLKRVRYFQRIILTAFHVKYCTEPLCWIAGCAIMKFTMRHLRECQLIDGSCSVSYCSTVRWIREHYCTCDQVHCAYCMVTNEPNAVLWTTHPLDFRVTGDCREFPPFGQSCRDSGLDIGSIQADSCVTDPRIFYNCALIPVSNNINGKTDIGPTLLLPSTSTAETVEVVPSASSSTLRGLEEHRQVIILPGNMDVKPTSSLPSTSTAETVEVEPVAFSSSLREFEDHSQVIILKGKLEIQPISSPPSTATKLLETGPAASSSPGVDDDNEEAVESPQKTRSQKQKAVTPDFMPLSRKKLKRSRVLHMEDGEQCAAATNQTPHDIKTNRMSRRSFWRKIPKLNPAGDNSGFVDEKSESENDNILVVDEVHKEYCPIHCVAVVIPKGCHSQFPRKPHTPRTPFIFQPFPAPDEDHSFDLLPQSQQNRNYQRIILTALHSQNCAREDCAIDNCAKMKITMAHSEDCEKDYGECPVWFCSTVSWMLGHYYVCRRRMCHLCFPISLAKHIINSNTHPLREHVIRIFLHRLALKQIPMCPGILAVPRTDRSICAKHYRSFNNYYLTNNEDSRVRIEVRQENDLRFHKLCNRRTNNKDIWDMAAYRLMELEEEWMKRLYKALPCVYNFCKGTCLCRSWPPEPDGFDTD